MKMNEEFVLQIYFVYDIDIQIINNHNRSSFNLLFYLIIIIVKSLIK